MNLKQRADFDLDPQLFGRADPEPVGAFAYRVPDTAPSEQRVLRMCLKAPESDTRVPEALSWLRGAIRAAMMDHRSRGLPNHGFLYATVRRGPVVDTTDDEWHVDGFSIRAPHPPEQNYIFSDALGTEWLDQRIGLPEDFDGMRHNIHSWFQAKADPNAVRSMEPGRFYLIDPYVPHRRPALSAGVRRTFIRISMVPVEIEDDRNTPNALLPRPKFNRGDIRDVLKKYGE